MGYSDDLVPLLNPRPGPELRFRQGLIVTWNAATGANVVDIGGTQIINVPVLNTGESIALKTGHIVGLLGIGGSYWIIGRITVPGDPQFASAAIDFVAGSNETSNFAIGAADAGAIVSTQIPVPAWATEAAVICTAMVSAANPRAVTDYLYVRALVSSQFGPAAIQGFAPWAASQGGYYGVGTAVLSTTVALAGAPTIFIGCRGWASGAAWTANASNIASVNAVALFRSGR